MRFERGALNFSEPNFQQGNSTILLKQPSLVAGHLKFSFTVGSTSQGWATVAPEEVRRSGGRSWRDFHSLRGHRKLESIFQGFTGEAALALGLDKSLPRTNLPWVLQKSPYP